MVDEAGAHQGVAQALVCPPRQVQPENMCALHQIGGQLGFLQHGCRLPVADSIGDFTAGLKKIFGLLELVNKTLFYIV
jgi:hypothetical protein